MTQRFGVEGGAIVLVSTVQGLVEEARRVREAFDATRPVAVALGVSPEAAAALHRYEPDPEADLFEDLTDHDFVYSARLATHGEVALPPPDLLEAVRLAGERGVSVYGVDLPEAEYEEAFTREVSVWGFLRYGRIQRALAKRPPRADDARAFSLAWDARIRRVKGLRVMESLRETRIAAGARALAKQESGVVLLVVDAPREAGVVAALSASSSHRLSPRGQDAKTPPQEHDRA